MLYITIVRQGQYRCTLSMVVSQGRDGKSRSNEMQCPRVNLSGYRKLSRGEVDYTCMFMMS